ncbi:MAG TPA: acyl-CoA dehydrogenase family protein [Acidimicrobiales bacterium]|nr:acyl-CoA dehydrogenase family protein [Acidimicrobiales bacterium]
MRFALTDEQLAFRDAVRDLLSKQCPPDVVRAAWGAPPGALQRGPWDALAEMGVLSAMSPEGSGGMGLDFCWMVAVLEETGRAALPHPVVETVAVLGPLRAPEGMTSAALGGTPAPCAFDADQLLVDHDRALRLYRREDVLLEELAAVDRARRLGVVKALNGDGEVVADDPAAIEAAFDRGALGTAAQLIGVGQAMLDLTVDYVKERRQFGVPVGSFQAVKHRLADAHKALAFARPAVLRAAWSVASSAPTTGRDVALAKAMASEAADHTGRACLQCHGAIGYTVEYDLHLFLKRAWALSRAWGDSRWHRRRVAAAIGI